MLDLAWHGHRPRSRGGVAMPESHREPRRHTAVLCSILQQSESQECDAALCKKKSLRARARCSQRSRGLARLTWFQEPKHEAYKSLSLAYMFLPCCRRCHSCHCARPTSHMALM